MKVYGLLSFYDEPLDLLVACVQGLASAGVDHVVALDGRYAAYTGSDHISDPNQHGTIVMACREAGLACTLSVPNGPWEGNEVEKRTVLFSLGWSLAEAGDWFWVQDADQIVTHVPADWKDRLAASEHDVASVMMHDPVMAANPSDDWPADFEMRSLFKAQPITVETNHCTYVTDDGRVLWGQVSTGGHRGRQQEDCLELLDVRVEHLAQARGKDRLAAKLAYYAERDASGIERGTCECGEPAVRLVARNWRHGEGIADKVIADWHEACVKHAARWEYEGRFELERLGADDPWRSVDSIHNRNGKIPTAV